MFHKHKRYLSQVIDGGIVFLEIPIIVYPHPPFLIFLMEKRSSKKEKVNIWLSFFQFLWHL